MYIHTLSNHCSIYSTIGICAVHRFLSISSYRLSQGLYKLLVEGYNKVVTDEFYLFHHTANHIHSDISHCLYNGSCQHESRIKKCPERIYKSCFRCIKARQFIDEKGVSVFTIVFTFRVFIPKSWHINRNVGWHSLIVNECKIIFVKDIINLKFVTIKTIIYLNDS